MIWLHPEFRSNNLSWTFRKFLQTGTCEWAGNLKVIFLNDLQGLRKSVSCKENVDLKDSRGLHAWFQCPGDLQASLYLPCRLYPFICGFDLWYLISVTDSATKEFWSWNSIRSSFSHDCSPANFTQEPRLYVLTRSNTHARNRVRKTDDAATPRPHLCSQ